MTRCRHRRPRRVGAGGRRATAAGERSASLIARAVEAKGGLEQAAVDPDRQGDGDDDDGRRADRSGRRSRRRRTSSIRARSASTRRRSAARSSQVFNGGECWVNDAPRRPRGARAGSRPDARHRPARRHRAAAGAGRRQGRPRRAFPTSSIDGRGLTRALASAAARCRPSSLLLDPATDLIVAQRYDVAGSRPERRDGGAVLRLPQRQRPPGGVRRRRAGATGCRCSSAACGPSSTTCRSPPLSSPGPADVQSRAEAWLVPASP